MAMGFDLAQGWAAYLKREVEGWGGVFETRDPNWSIEAGAQAITDLINAEPHPDVLVVHAPDLNSYVKLFKKAQEKGIYVILIDNPANFAADAFIGSDWNRLGQLEAEACANDPKKEIGLVQGDQVNSSSLYQYAGIMKVLAKYPDFKVVAKPDSNWDATTARNVTATMLQQNPDICWLKNRHKVLDEVYVAPIYHRMGETQSAVPESGSPYALNNRISKTEYIGLGELEGPEDVILDRDDHLYCGTRHGEIVRFFAPDYRRWEVFAHTGGFPLGLAFDREGTLLFCVGAMGLYAISKTGEVKQLSAQWSKRLNVKAINDNARVVELSGGNQQKVVIGKGLIQKPRLVIFDEPTRGVDVGAIAEIHQFIGGLANEGLAVGVISSYLPEIMNLSDRILVCRQGRVVEEISPLDATEEKIMYAAVH